MTMEQQQKIVEVDESEPVNENDWKKVFWSDEDAKLIGEFLRGRPVLIDGSDEAFSRLTESTDFAPKKQTEIRNRQKRELLLVAEEKLASVSESSPSAEVDDVYGKIETEEEYETVNRLVGRTIMRLAIGSLVKRGVMSPEGLKYLIKSKLRKKDGGYVYDDWMGESVEDKVAPENPEMTILAPSYRTGGDDGEEAVREFGNKRLRGSFAHEADHQIRALSNKMLWEGIDPIKVSELNQVKRLFIGGYRVGSNKQGSEGVGNFFSEIVKLKAADQSTTIADLIGPIANKLRDNLKKDKVEPRYRVALTALMDHLNQLTRLGYGDLQAEDLLAMGMCGYSSLEKMPDLIRTEIMSKEKHEKMKQVAADVLGWLTSKSESGFSLPSL